MPAAWIRASTGWSAFSTIENCPRGPSPLGNWGNRTADLGSAPPPGTANPPAPGTLIGDSAPPATAPRVGMPPASVGDLSWREQHGEGQPSPAASGVCWPAPVAPPQGSSLAPSPGVSPGVSRPWWDRGSRGSGAEARSCKPPALAGGTVTHRSSVRDRSIGSQTKLGRNTAGCVRAMPVTCQPSFNKACVTANPMPRLAPVTMALRIGPSLRQSAACAKLPDHVLLNGLV